MITGDNVGIQIDSVLYFTITDAKSVSYEVANPLQAIEQLTVTTLRNVIGGMTLEEALTSRDTINSQLRTVLDEATGRWGIRVNRVEVKAIDPPASIQEAMEKQMRAERDRRAAILTAEGSKQSQILTAEGEKQSAVLTRRGPAEAAILRAEGEAKAIDTVFQRDPRRRSRPGAALLPVPADAAQARPGRREQDLRHPERVQPGAGQHRRRDRRGGQAGAAAAATAGRCERRGIVADAVEAYAAAHTTPPAPFLQALADETRATLQSPQMLTGEVEGRFLEFLVFLAQPRLVLEIGTYSGYSALSMAQALPAGGRIVTLRARSASASTFAERHIAARGLRRSHRGAPGPGARDDRDARRAVRPRLHRRRQARLPGLLRGRAAEALRAGLIVVDNVLWSGCASLTTRRPLRYDRRARVTSATCATLRGCVQRPASTADEPRSMQSVMLDAILATASSTAAQCSPRAWHACVRPAARA